MYLISRNVEKCFFVASWSPGRTPLINPLKSYVVDVVAYLNVLETYLISKNVGKHFVVASWSPERILLITPLKSYVIDVVAFCNCKMLVEVFLSYLECYVHPIFIGVRGRKGCLWLAKGCQFNTWRIVIRSCIWLGLPTHLDTWRHLVGIWCLVTWHKFWLQGDLGLEFNKNGLIYL